MSQQSFTKIFLPRDDGLVKVEETLARYAATDLEGSPGHLLREMRARGGRLPWVSKGARNTAALVVQSLALPPRTRQALCRWIAGAPYLSPPLRPAFASGSLCVPSGSPLVRWSRWLPSGVDPDESQSCEAGTDHLVSCEKRNPGASLRDGGR